MHVQVLCYTIAWVIYIIAQSFFLHGIRIASSGTTEKRPDGTEEDSNMILYPIAKWLNRHWINKVYYSYEEQDKLIAQLKKEFSGIMPPVTTYPIYPGLIVTTNEELDLLVGIAKRLEPRGIKYSVNGNAVMFYKEYKVYVLSKWVRMPTLGCIKCMPSYWSLLTYWLPMIVVFGFHWWLIPLWIANISSVTFVNTYLVNKYNAD